MIAIIDNYDSFTYNLYQFIGEICPAIRVFRNDEIDAAELIQLQPSHLVISPGPGRPSDAGNCISLVQQLEGQLPILGVCLGHQAICESYGATITYAQQLMHGKQSAITIAGDCPLFAELPSRFAVARYHSLAVDPTTLPSCLRLTASTNDGEVMAIAHEYFPTFGVQFHPESILTPHGKHIMGNFLAIG